MNNSTATDNQPPVLITGVSSGIGLGMAEKFIQEGHRVFGSLRSAQIARQLENKWGERFVPLIFDICSSEQIAIAQQQLSEELDGKPLAALINNAGSAEIGPLLYTPPEDLLRQLDILVAGQLRVIQAFHPLLLASEGASGRIYNISSISGMWPNIYFGSYCAGKHGLEGLSKTLRLELHRYGIKVIVVAPGNIATDIWTKQTLDVIEKYEKTNYYMDLKKYLERIQSETIKEAMSIEEFSSLFYDIFCTPDPANRYTIMKSKGRFPFSLFSQEKTRVMKG